MLITDKKNESNIKLKERISFFEKNSPYFAKLQKSAKDIAAQNLPVLVCSKDVLMRKWFSELVCFEKYQDVCRLVYIPCSVYSGKEVFQTIKSVSSESCIILDRIDSLSIDFQNGLVDAISNGYFEKKGISLIAGTSENLDFLCEQNLFSKSLCFRLNLLKVNIISLNENRSEIQPLAGYFLENGCDEFGIPFKGFSDNAVLALKNHFWNGESGELKNVVERAIIFGEPPFVLVEDLGFEMTDYDDLASDISQKLSEDKSLKSAVDSFKRVYVKKILEENGNNQTRTAQVLGVQRTYLARLLSELNLR